MTVNKERMEMWIRELEAGGHQQCQGTLVNSTSGVISHCAEGIGILVALREGDFNVFEKMAAWVDGTMPPQIKAWYGLRGGSGALITHDEGGQSTVVTANDGLHMSFWDIAQGMRRTYLKDEGNGHRG